MYVNRNSIAEQYVGGKCISLKLFDLRLSQHLRSHKNRMLDGGPCAVFVTLKMNEKEMNSMI